MRGPYWDAAALADTFERFCAGEVEPSQIFWRAINTEIWMRVFFDHDGGSRLGAAPGSHFTRIGDEWLAARNERAAAALAQFSAARPTAPVRAVDGRRSRLRTCTDPHAAVRER